MKYVANTSKTHLYIPVGAQCIESWIFNGELIVMGKPEAGDGHDCKKMGCRKTSHVLHRFPLNNEAPQT